MRNKIKKANKRNKIMKGILFSSIFLSTVVVTETSFFHSIPKVHAVTTTGSQYVLNNWSNYPKINSPNFDGGWAVNGDVLYTTKNIHWTGFWNSADKEATDRTFEMDLRLSSAHADPFGWTFRHREISTNTFSFYAVEIGPYHNEITLAKINSWTPSINDPVHAGPLYHGTISSADGYYENYGGWDRKAEALRSVNGDVLAYAPINWNYGNWHRLKIENIGNNIKIWYDGILIIDYTDNNNPLTHGGYGPYTASQYLAEYKNIYIDGSSFLNVPPQITVSTPTVNSQYIAGISDTMYLSGTIYDPDNKGTMSVKYSIDNGTEQTLTTMPSNSNAQGYGGNIVLPSNLTNGTHTIQIWGTDSEKGFSPKKNISFNYIKDTTGPSVSISKSTTSWIKEGDITLTATATDDISGVRYIELPDGSKVNGSTATFKASINGNYTFTVTDNSGNVTKKTVSVTNIDKNNPILTLTQTPSQWTNAPVKINASAVDNESGVKRIQLPDGNWVSSSNTNYTVSTNSDYTFKVEDNVGNTTTKTLRIANIDMLVPNAPTLTINVPENTWVDQDVIATIKDNGDEGGSGYIVEYKLEGAITQDWREYKDKVKIEKDGKTKILARVRDNAGNISPIVTKSFQIDQDAPTITVTPDVYLLTNTDVNLTVKADDNGGQGVKRIQLPNGNWVYTDKLVYTVSENGTYTFKAEDNAGHISSYEFRVGNIKKNVLITPIRPVDLELHSEDLSEVTQMQFQNEDEGWSSWMTYSNFADWVLSEEDGLKHVWVRYKDKVGNMSEKIEDIIILDQTKPDLEFVKINDDAPYTKTRDVKLKLKGSDNLTGVKTIFLSNDNKTWVEHQYTEDAIDWTLPAGDGTKTVYAKINDGAGNLSTIKTDTIFLDTTKPLADILINNGDAYSATRDVQLKLTYSDGGSGIDKVKVIEGEHEYTLPAPTPNSPVTIPWTLDFGVVKTVSILVTDKAGNTSELMSDSITVDKLTIKDFVLEDVVNPLEFDRKHPFQEKVWAFEPQPMIAGGNITFAIDVKSAYDRSVVDDSLNYKVEIVGEGSYHKAFVGTMDKTVDHYTKTITIPKDAPNGAKVYFTGTATRVLTVSPYDTQTVYFPGDTDASQRAFIGVVDGNIYDVIRFNETK